MGLKFCALEKHINTGHKIKHTTLTTTLESNKLLDLNQKYLSRTNKSNLITVAKESKLHISYLLTLPELCSTIKYTSSTTSPPFLNGQAGRGCKKVKETNIDE